MNRIEELIEFQLTQKYGCKIIEKEIEKLFFEISKTGNVDEANLLFDKLEEIQYLLAKIIFKYDIKVTPFIRQFVYDFDRIDDKETRDYLYKKIKK